MLVTVRHGGIVADQTGFTAGSGAGFIVTNDGSRRHEVMIEQLGANEKPLDEHGEQAGTEDLAPGEVAVIVYTFTESGSVQLAGQIGDNDLVVRIEVS